MSFSKWITVGVFKRLNGCLYEACSNIIETYHTLNFLGYLNNSNNLMIWLISNMKTIRSPQKLSKWLHEKHTVNENYDYNNSITVEYQCKNKNCVDNFLTG